MIGLSGNLWPIHLKPYSDELLSSWLVRLAHAHGLKLQTFCGIVFGQDKSIWNRDIDKFAPDWLTNHLSVATGTNVESVINTTLKSYEGILYEQHQPNGNTLWINPLGIYHRIHRHHGLQYCPMCLAQDKDPYFRKYWRLSFYTECEKHHILLHDRCPNCGVAINFHRVEMGKRSLIKPMALTSCYQCSFDLRGSSINRLDTGDWKTTVTHRTLLRFHEMGWAFTDKLTFHYSWQLFNVLRHLCGMMSSVQRAKCLLPLVANILGIDVSQLLLAKSIPLEKRCVHLRHILFYCSIWLITDWPNRFIETCLSHKLTNSYILHDYTNSPFWFYSTVDNYLNNSPYSPATV